MVHIDFGFPNNNSFKNLNSLLYWLIIFHHQIIFGAVLTIQSPIPPFPRLMNKKKDRVSTGLSEKSYYKTEKYLAEDQYFHIKCSCVCSNQEPKIFQSACETN